MVTAAEAEEARSYRFPERAVTYTARDAIIYNLGIGCTEDRYCYEGSPDFGPFPTIPLVLALKGTSTDIVPFGDGLFIPPSLSSVPMTSILHGEQHMEFLEPLPMQAPKGRLVMRGRVASLDDKGKGSVLSTESEVVEVESGKVLVRMLSGVYLRGVGGFGGGGGVGKSRGIKMPNRQSDVRIVDQTLEIQAKLYRLSGDYNPLHIDTDVAVALGFKRPIAHGLCNFASVARCIVREACGGDPNKLKWIRGRLVAPAFPGDILAIDIWKEKDVILASVATGKRTVLVVEAGVDNARGAITNVGGKTVKTTLSRL